MPWHWDTGHFSAAPIPLLELIEAVKLSQIQQDRTNKFCPFLTLLFSFLKNGNCQDRVYAVKGVYAAGNAFGMTLN